MGRLAVISVLALILSGCGAAGQGGHDERSAGEGRLEITITGGSPQQEALLREILEGLGSPSFDRIEIGPADSDWAPFEAGAIGLTIHGSKDLRGHWQGELLAGVFAQRSSEQGLPQVVYFAGGLSASRIEGPDPQPGSPSPLSADEMDRIADRFRSLARANGARVLELEILRPDRYAFSATLATAEPARFLQNRLEKLLAIFEFADEKGYDGWHVRLVDQEGRFVWEQASVSAGALRGGLARTNPRYEACVGASSALDDTPPPCPSGDSE
jgi:hypothetical protein